MNNQMVCVVDDDPAILESVGSSFRSVGVTTHTYRSAEEFIGDRKSADATCLILDLRMPGMTGMMLIEWLRAEHIDLPVVVHTGHGNIPAVVDSMKLGAVEFLQKPTDNRVLVHRVLELLKLEMLRSDKRAKTQAIRDNFATLTKREKQLVELLASGMSSKMIAASIGISVKTVENHRSHALAKTGAVNVASLVRMRMIVGDELSC